MRTKTKYREIQPNNSTQNIPAEKELPPVAVVAPEGPAVTVAIEPQPQAAAPQEGDASLALQRQLEALKKSEELQLRQPAQIIQPQTREQKLRLWKQQGLSDTEAHFLEQHPTMIDFPQIANAAAAEAMQAGHARDSEAYWKATEMIFDNHLTRLRAQTSPAEQPTPEFFKPPPPMAPPERTSIYSAPVSRGVPSSGPREENPRQMTLSPDELAIAKASNISAVDYAKGKLDMMRRKQRGEIQ